MANNGHLRTVRMGGFDKSDVREYVNELTSKIYELESQLAANQGMGDGASNADFEGKEHLEKKVEEATNKVAELMASVDELKEQLKNKEKEIDALKEQVKNSANGESTSSFDFGSVFMEAQNTANKVVSEAKKAAKQMTDDANEKAEKIIADAEAEAKSKLESVDESVNSITDKAKEEAEKLIDDATSEAAIIRSKSEDIRETVRDEYKKLSENVTSVISTLNDLFGASIGAANKARDLIDDGLSLVEEE